MNPLRYCLLVGVWLLISGSFVFGLPEGGKTKIESIDKKYSVYLTDSGEQWVYKLNVARSGEILQSYRFQGELVSAYWSPTSKYVVVNNHYGHAGWWIWIISLSNGAVITEAGPCRDPNYDRYSDIDDYGPNIFEIMKGQIAQLYKDYSNDNMREGWLSVAYGWTRDGYLKMFYQFPFDDLSQKQDSTIYGYSLDELKDGKVTVAKTWVKICDDRGESGIPKEARRTFDY
jgi:hypothetical protein